MKHGRINIKR